MTFENGLKAELKEIEELKNKVYPVVAPEGIKPPFLVYLRRNLRYQKTLSGYTEKAEGSYNLVLIASDYDESQLLQDKIKEKIMSIPLREIGGTGPYIHDMDIEFGADNYVQSPNAFRSDITISVNY